MRDLYQAAAARPSDGAITMLQGRSVGGSTTVNWTSSFRTPADAEVLGRRTGGRRPWVDDMKPVVREDGGSG